MSIEVRELNKSFGVGTPFEKQVLFNINLQIEDGEFVGIIGPTRAGKTTLAQHFNALYVPRAGKVLVDGKDTADKHTDVSELRLQVGYVFQNPEHQLFKETVKDDVAFGPEKQGCSTQETDRRVREALELVGLDYQTFYQRDIFALSGGQKRRVAIAGVLACNPRVLILDDVTAGLDPRGRDQILEVVSRLHREKKLTIVFISHSMDEVARLTSRTIVMDEGRLVMDGPTTEIFLRADELEALGLELPQVTRVLRMLHREGFSVPLHLPTLEEAVEAIAGALSSTGVRNRWN